MDKILVNMGLSSFKTYYIFVMSCPEIIQLLEWHLLRQNYDFLVIWACERPSNKISSLVFKWGYSLNTYKTFQIGRPFNFKPKRKSRQCHQFIKSCLHSLGHLVMFLKIVIHWCKSNCGFALLSFAVLYWNTFLNKYVIYHFNAHFSLCGFCWWLTAAAAAANSFKSCPTLCDPIDGSPRGSPVPGFSRQEHWSGLPFPSPMHESEKWKWSCSVVSDS